MKLNCSDHSVEQASVGLLKLQFPGHSLVEWFGRILYLPSSLVRTIIAPMSQVSGRRQ